MLIKETVMAVTIWTGSSTMYLMPTITTFTQVTMQLEMVFLQTLISMIITLTGHFYQSFNRNYLKYLKSSSQPLLFTMLELTV